MSNAGLKSVSPLDGRYGPQLGEMARLGSEEALIGYRIKVESAWLLFLVDHPSFKGAFGMPPACREWLKLQTKETEWEKAALSVKELERTTNHDVKAVEYYLRDNLKRLGGGGDLLAFIHFGCTSEDINNTAYGLMLKDTLAQVIEPFWGHIIQAMCLWAKDAKDIPMLARTHGQPASPTTLGKEWAVFAHRLERQRQQLSGMPILAKWSGAVGNYNAHLAAFPELKWDKVAGEFIETLGLKQNPLTTQIENHDNLIEHLDVIRRFNSVLLGFCRDIWGYIGLGYLRQKLVAGEVGSSTMPHKVNPIDFENAEGNLGLAIALGQHFSEKLPISRWQRDLSDSTVLRNVASLFSYSLLAYKSVLKGIAKLDCDRETIAKELDEAWEVLGEGLQTVMRRFGVSDAYERLKAATRGQKADGKKLMAVLDDLTQVPAPVRQSLKNMQPKDYVGMAPELVENFLKEMAAKR